MITEAKANTVERVIHITNFVGFSTRVGRPMKMAITAKKMEPSRQ